MNSWEKIPIGEIFSLEKGSLQSTKCTPGDYTFITASSEWKTHNEYSHDCEALVYAVAASGSLGRCHHYSGKFISSDLCFILRAKDEKKHPINYRFYQNVFRFLKDDIVAKTKAGTSKESISQKRFSAYTLPYIDIKHQSYWENKLNNLNDNIENFEVESTNQASYLTKLRQAILQEAIEGKLTADWRKENPVRKGDPDYDAEALLEKIQAEKEKLIKEKIFKREKKQESAIVVEIKYPTEWIAPHLGDVAKYITDGTHQTPTYVSSGRPFLSAQNVKPFKFMPVNYNYVSESAFIEYTKSIKAEKNDLLVGRVGSKGETAVIDIDIDFAFYVSLALVKTFKELTLPKYLAIVMNSPFGNEYATANMSSLGASAGNFNLGRIRSFPIPLPPIVEQQAIVDHVEKLLSTVDELEKQVSERKEQSEQLMQAVLREAFEGGK